MTEVLIDSWKPAMFMNASVRPGELAQIYGATKTRETCDSVKN